jgi:CBS domain-containing protein
MAQPQTPDPSDAAPLIPSPSLLANLRQDLSRHPPFAQMAPADVEFFLVHATQRYYAPGEVLVDPAAGVVQEIFVIRSGTVTGVRGLSDAQENAFQYEAGDMFPISAAVADRPVTATYTAAADTFVLVLPRAVMDQLASASAAFADFLNRRILGFLELSRAALQASYASQGLAEQSLETPLGQLIKHAPVSCQADTPLAEALGEMQRRRIGSMLVVDGQGRPEGILTRFDVLDRVALGQVPLHTPIGQVMVAPVHTLRVDQTAQDAALLMSRHGVRHVPVTRDGVAVGLVSERDLFAMQRLSLKQVSTSIRAAADVATLQQVAQDIRNFARNLLGQGVQARQLTALISHLNDLLTQRLLELKAHQHGVRWIACAGSRWAPRGAANRRSPPTRTTP